MPESIKRCAIYTRKSFDPPIGQEITSLETQRAICASYVVSQRHRGWVEITHHYDDSGRTGSDTHRPALQQLLGDVEAGLIDVVLVYKLDPLTRTLFDFVRLTDFLERHGVAFVSITQNFDTSDILGRLILNILLTFAQFEREILSDRMRDKIRVLKRMGRWVGGTPPLGYDVIRKRLVINRAEAEAVRTIFNTYIESQNTEIVHKRLRELGFRRKVWKARSGAVFGGGPVTLSSLHHILRNPIYVGQVSHRGEVYPGIHQPILNREIFNEAQKLLARNQRHPRVVANLLTGLLFDTAGRPMCMTDYAYKGYRIRYYASNVSAWARRRKLKRMRADGDGLERLITASLKTLFLDREQIRQILLGHGVHGAELDSLTRSGSIAAQRFASASPTRISDILHGLLERIELTSEYVVVLLWKEELRRFLRWDGVGLFGMDTAARQRIPAVHFLRIPASVVRARKIFALPVTAATPENNSSPDEKLVGLLNEAARAKSLLIERRDLDLPGLATEYGCQMDRFSRLIRLNYLAPDIWLMIRDGSQPPGLNRSKLLAANLPLDWATQRTLLGFPPQPEHFRNPNVASTSE